MVDELATEQYFTICCLGVFLVAFAGIGILLLVKHNRDKQKVDATQTWASTSGQIRESSVHEYIEDRAEGGSTSLYMARIKYTYQVNGQEYTGEDVAVGGESTSIIAGPANALVARYPIGRQVIVYYNPQNPAQGVLERRPSGGKTSLVIGILLLALAACSLCSLAYMLITTTFYK